MQFIDLKKQYKLIEDKILARITNVLNHGQYIMGEEVLLLEQTLAEFVGSKYAIVNSSGTDALFMSLLALDLSPDDEIITTPFSFFSAAEVIVLCNARPVFVDINPDTYNIDVNKITAAITKKTKAIIPVSLYGQMANMTMINKIAVEYNLAVIEDAAQSFGATHNQQYSCAVSTVGCTSFFPSKPLGGYGDSGACFTNDDILAQKLIEIRIHGQSGRYYHNRIGINGRMDTLQAAILLEKMQLLPQEILLRQQIAARYNNLLGDIVKIPYIEPGNTSVFAQYTIEVPNRDQFQQHMNQLDIPTAIHYPLAMHQQHALLFLGYQTGSFPYAEKAGQNVISLPMHPYLTMEEQDIIVAGVKSSLLSGKTV